MTESPDRAINLPWRRPPREGINIAKNAAALHQYFLSSWLPMTPSGSLRTFDIGSALADHRQRLHRAEIAVREAGTFEAGRAAAGCRKIVERAGSARDILNESASRRYGAIPSGNAGAE
jgi:hypothetical protein